ncbi:sel1 repeat family protein [Marinomonas sp.]|nr:tetratricopeptide repeat protein [Marinomonas sp.]MDB4837340.1 sel1 repeat family protein [Marinomonas sp.]
MFFHWNYLPQKTLSIPSLLQRFGLLCALVLLSACASKTTLEKYQTKADEGDVEKQLLLADSYFFGTEDLPKNKVKAIEYYRLAADNGSDSAAFTLGLIYQRDALFPESIHYYEIAAAADNAKAQDNLGILYHHGTGATQNLEKAEQLYLQALSNGSQYSQRNLAVLYKDSQQTDKAIEMFKTLAFTKTSRAVPYKFKSSVSQSLMDLYLSKQDLRNAYIWGATAVLSGLFDSNIPQAKEIKSRYENLLSELREREYTKDNLAKSVVINHYHVFQQFEPSIKKYTEFLISDGIIALSTDKSVELAAYKMSLKKDIYQGIERFDSRKDKKSRINFALYYLKLASFEIALGAISPHFHSAVSSIEKSLMILGNYNDSNLDHLKQTTELKLDIVKQVANYQRMMTDHR